MQITVNILTTSKDEETFADSTEQVQSYWKSSNYVGDENFKTSGSKANQRTNNGLLNAHLRSSAL